MRSRILPIVLLCVGSCASPTPGPGRLLLSNPDFPLTNVEAVITAAAALFGYGYAAWIAHERDNGYISTLEFTMPNNATKFIDVPAGANICWRSDRNPGRPVAGRWSRWDRAFIVPGRTISANL